LFFRLRVGFNLGRILLALRDQHVPGEASRRRPAGKDLTKK
jgi:hypothetical protein